MVARLRPEVVLPVEQGAGGGDGRRRCNQGNAGEGDERRHEQEEDVALGHFVFYELFRVKAAAFDWVGILKRKDSEER